MAQPLISVVVCTFNRAQLLAKLLSTVGQQTLDSKEYEIIVVDNKSTDHTAEIAKEFASRHPNSRYVYEDKQGLSHARNCGWRNAQGEYVAYIDDDCEAPTHWLRCARDIIETFSPAVLGGPYIALFKTPRPPWFKDSYESRDHGSEARVLNSDEYVTGMNIFIRRSLLVGLGGFDPNLGMNGNRIAYGEEGDLQSRIRTALTAQIIYYDPGLAIYNVVRDQQTRLYWLSEKFYSKGRSLYRMNPGRYRSQGRLRILLVGIRTVAALLFDLLFALFKRDRAQYPFLQNYFYERTQTYLAKLGRLFEQYKHVTNIRSKAKRKKKVIFLMGTGHSGSTLLDLILGSHSQAFSLGEFRLLGVKDRKAKPKSDSYGVCGVCGEKCTFWNASTKTSVLRSYFGSGKSAGHLIFNLNRRFASLRCDIYRHLFDWTNAGLLIDSSKRIWWIRRQLRPFWFWRNTTAFLIYICRDGRAVTNSYLRKYPDLDVANLATKWVRQTQAMEGYFDSFHKDRRIKVSYEDLAENPERVIRSLCELLGVPYEGSMLQFWQHNHHPINGNAGTYSLIQKHRQEADIAKGLGVFYEQLGTAIKPDLRWQHEMSDDQLRKFDEIAGEVNKRYAYDSCGR